MEHAGQVLSSPSAVEEDILDVGDGSFLADPAVDSSVAFRVVYLGALLVGVHELVARTEGAYGTGEQFGSERQEAVADQHFGAK